MKKSRAEQKADIIGISCLTFDEIRNLVLNSQDPIETIGPKGKLKPFIRSIRKASEWSL